MKKFLIPKDGKTGRLVAKNIIILAVLIAVCGLAVWSWFTNQTGATADGISVMCKGEGVEVSWDNIDFYTDLTKREQSSVEGTTTTVTSTESSDDTIGPAKNLCDSSGNPLSLNLVTGNGLDFFEPYTNRRTGTILLNNDSSWQGIKVNGNNSSGRYVDIDLYFRSTKARDVFLAGDSAVSPKNLYGNYSDYGLFSKDNIAAASRIAFLNSNKDACSFIWAPNSNVQLVENESGYKKYTTTETAGAGDSSGTLGDVIDFTTQNGNYYLWLPTNYTSDPNTQDSSLVAHKMNFTVYDETNNTGLYTFEYTIREPNTGKDPTIIYYVNQSGTTWNSNDISYVDVSKSYATNDISDSSPRVALSRDSFNLNTTSTQQDRKASAFYVQGFKTQEITITIGYNPVTKQVVVIGYSSTGAETKTYNRIGVDTEEVTYYPLDGDVTCALVNPDTEFAFSTEVNYRKSINFLDVQKQNVSPLSITNKELFTVEKTGDGYEATYQFINASNDSAIAIDNGIISFSSGETEFTLKYVEGVEGPVLTIGDYYLASRNGRITAAKLSSLNPSDVVTVYVGSSYKVVTDATQEVYQFYNHDDKEIQVLNSTTSPKLYPSSTSTSATTLIGNGTKIVTLEKESDSEYYTAHIVMRVWVEGTDREAKTPLADGIFNISLHFTSQ